MRKLHGHSKHENEHDNGNDNDKVQCAALTSADHDSSVSRRSLAKSFLTTSDTEP